MAKGLPKSYIKKYGISKRAWQEYRKSKGKPSRSRKTGRKTMAKKKGRRRYKMTIPLAPTLGLVAGMMGPISQLVTGNWKGAINELSRGFIGYAPDKNEWFPQYIVRGLGPIVAGLLIHKFVGGYLGVNRMLGRARVPLLRL